MRWLAFASFVPSTYAVIKDITSSYGDPSYTFVEQEGPCTEDLNLLVAKCPAHYSLKPITVTVETPKGDSVRFKDKYENLLKEGEGTTDAELCDDINLRSVPFNEAIFIVEDQCGGFLQTYKIHIKPQFDDQESIDEQCEGDGTNGVAKQQSAPEKEETKYPEEDNPDDYGDDEGVEKLKVDEDISQPPEGYEETKADRVAEETGFPAAHDVDPEPPVQELKPLKNEGPIYPSEMGKGPFDEDASYPKTPPAEVYQPVALSCDIEHAKLVGDDCRCRVGYVGTIRQVGSKFVGFCKPVFTGKWPCTGEVPFICGRCPTCAEADGIMLDLEQSCSIPPNIGLDNIVWHTQHGEHAMIHPDIKRNLCISPICRWRIELAHNAFSLCQTLAGKNIAITTRFRDKSYTLHTFKRVINVLHKSKNDCHVVRSATNVNTSIMLRQKYLVTGIDVRSDATMRSAEVAYRSAFSRVLNWPKRRLDVRVEPQLCDLDPICDHKNCGYGACVPHWDLREKNKKKEETGWFGGLFSGMKENVDVDLGPENADYGYRCLCNECFTEEVVGGIRTCVREKTCTLEDHCNPNPCSCSGACAPCPECYAKGEEPFTCSCPSFFSGSRCEVFQCPDGFVEDVNNSGSSPCERSCVPRDVKNPCTIVQCQHSGVCVPLASDGSKASNPENATGWKCECPNPFTGLRCEKFQCMEGTHITSTGCVADEYTKPPETLGQLVNPHCVPLQGRDGTPSGPCYTGDISNSLGGPGTSPCMNNGFCQVHPMASAPTQDQQFCAFNCVCIAGYKGDRCQIEETNDICSRVHCEGNAKCIPTQEDIDGYRCECDEWCKQHEAISRRLLANYEGVEHMIHDPSKGHRWADAKKIDTEYQAARRRQLLENEADWIDSGRWLHDEDEFENDFDTNHYDEDYEKLRRLERAPDDIQTDWEGGGAIPFVRPLPKDDLPEHNHCMVWQYDGGKRAELVLTVKCPRDDQEQCSHMMETLERMHQRRNFRALEHVARYSCIPTHVNATSEVTEEILMSNCPTKHQMDTYWNRVWRGCNFENCQLGEDEELQVIISKLGAESVDNRFKPSVCRIPFCRALIMEYAALFKDCRNSAPGNMGKQARKAKALNNFVKSCSNPDVEATIAVIRQQVKIVGVIDELSHHELTAVEDFVKQKLVARKLGMADQDEIDKRLFILTRPGLKRLNSVSARFIDPVGEFKPTILPEKAGQVDSSCTGLCVMTDQPGPDPLTAMDPSAHVYVTFNNPILPGDCWYNGDAYCQVTLKLQTEDSDMYDSVEEEMYQLNDLDGNIFISGETMFLKPWYTLKPFSTYSVHIPAIVIKPVSGLVASLSSEYVYEFKTGAPAGSLVYLSLSLGCISEDDCHFAADKLKDYATSPDTTIVEPIRQFIDGYREQMKGDTGFKVSSRRLAAELLVNEEFVPNEELDVPNREKYDDLVAGIHLQNFEADLAKAEKHHELLEQERIARANRKMTIEDYEEDLKRRRLQADKADENGGLQKSQGTAGNPEVETRVKNEHVCNVAPTWLFWNIFAILVFVLTMAAVFSAGRATSWWVQDAFSSHTGYFKCEMPDPNDPDKKIIYWKSVVTENSWSFSRMLRGPTVWWPLIAFITIAALWILGFFICATSSGPQNGFMCGATAAIISCMVFALLSLITSTWVAPANVPFYPMRDRFKNSEDPWRSNAWKDAPKPGEAGPRPGPGLTQKDSTPEGKPLCPPDNCADGTQYDQRDSGMQEMMLKGVEYHESDKEITFTIPKPKASSRFQPDRLNDPYRVASHAAGLANILGILALIFGCIALPMNAIHICPDYFMSIFWVALIALIVTLIVRFLTYKLTKSHCQFWDDAKTQQAHEYLQLRGNEND